MAGTEEFFDVTRPGQNSFYDVDFQNILFQNFIPIFLINQKFYRYLSHHHHGLCYYVLISKVIKKQPFLRCSVPAKLPHKNSSVPAEIPYKNFSDRAKLPQKTTPFRPNFLVSFPLYCIYPVNTGVLKCIIMTKYVVLTLYSPPFLPPNPQTFPLIPIA